MPQASHTHSGNVDPTLPEALGLVTRKELVATYGRRAVDRLVAEGRLERMGRGVFALPGTPPEVVAAVRAGGAVSCKSALQLHGVWTLDDKRLHLSRSKRTRERNALPPGSLDCRPRAVPDAIVHPVEAALSCVLARHGADDAVVAFDSIIRLGLLTTDELARIAAAQSATSLRLLDRADGRVDSALESVLRHRLRSANVRVRTQVHIAGVGRVDFLLGDRLILETDGFEFHASTATFRNDRQRDRRALARGYLVVRLTWSDVLHDWDRVWPELRELLRRRVHRARRGPE